MRTRTTWMMVAALVVVAGLGAGLVARAQSKMTMRGPSIEGTWRLVSRSTPDGKTVMPPDIIGLQTFTKDLRNFNVYWTDNTGKHFSYSVVSTYKLTDNEYSETVDFALMNDEIGNHPLAYTTRSDMKTVPVTKTGNRIEFKMPFDPPTAVFDGNKLIATAPGQFTDTWERVK